MKSIQMVIQNTEEPKALCKDLEEVLQKKRAECNEFNHLIHRLQSKHEDSLTKEHRRYPKPEEILLNQINQLNEQLEKYEIQIFNKKKL
jgi:hypothetical protein